MTRRLLVITALLLAAALTSRNWHPRPGTPAPDDAAPDSAAGDWDIDLNLREDITLYGVTLGFDTTGSGGGMGGWDVVFEAANHSVIVNGFREHGRDEFDVTWYAPNPDNEDADPDAEMAEDLLMAHHQFKDAGELRTYLRGVAAVLIPAGDQT